MISFFAGRYSHHDVTARLLPFRAPERAPVPRGADALAALADAASAGKPAAVRTLVVSVTPALLRAARGVLGAQHPDVEDVAQEAALGLVNALPSYRRECSVLHFAGRIGVLTALGTRRRLRARAEQHHIEFVEHEQAPSAVALPGEELSASRRRQILRELCDELPAEQSEALVLHCVMGMTVDEVAAASATPRNTVRSRLRLAKQALRTRIEGDPYLSEALGVVR